MEPAAPDNRFQNLARERLAKWAKTASGTDLQRLTEGQERLRLAGVDLSQTRTAVFVMEVFAPFHEAQRKKGKATTEQKEEEEEVEDKDESPNNFETSFFDLLDDHETNPYGEYNEKVKNIVMKIQFIACYMINISTGFYQAWVHPKIRATEVDEVVKMRAELRNITDKYNNKWRSSETPFADLDQQHKTMYLRYPALLEFLKENSSKSNKPLYADGEDTSPSGIEHGYLWRIKRLVKILRDAIFAPFFVGQPLLTIEPQVDQTWYARQKYQRLADRCPVLLKALYDAIQKCKWTDPAVAMELIERYDRTVGDSGGSEMRLPENWMTSLAFGAAVAALDEAYGYDKTRLIAFKAAKYANAEYLRAYDGGGYFGYDQERNRKLWSAGRLQKARKLSPIATIRKIILLQQNHYKKGHPEFEALASLEEFITMSVVNKDDNLDVGDAAGIAFKYCEDEIRSTKYNVKEREEINREATELWNREFVPAVEAERLRQEEQAARVDAYAKPDAPPKKAPAFKRQAAPTEAKRKVTAAKKNLARENALVDESTKSTAKTYVGQSVLRFGAASSSTTKAEPAKKRKRPATDEDEKETQRERPMKRTKSTYDLSDMFSDTEEVVETPNTKKRKQMTPSAKASQKPAASASKIPKPKPPVSKKRKVVSVLSDDDEPEEFRARNSDSFSEDDFETFRMNESASLGGGSKSTGFSAATKPTKHRSASSSAGPRGGYRDNERWDSWEVDDGKDDDKMFDLSENWV